MSEGKGIEYSHPYLLLVNKVGDLSITNISSQFARMVLTTGEANA